MIKLTDRGKAENARGRREMGAEAGRVAMAQTIEKLQREWPVKADSFPDPITLIFAGATRRYYDGVVKYGKYNPVEDTRDFRKEAGAEILDAINYLAMFLMKIRASQSE
jgi:hypothetical protein